MLTHGNGPEVGELMAMDGQVSHAMEEWVAATQDMIGHTFHPIEQHSQTSPSAERTAVVLTESWLMLRMKPLLPTKPGTNPVHTRSHGA